MAQNHIDWTTRIQEAVEATYDTHVPPDITFKVVENGSTYNIEAHKIVMGWVSRVCNRNFFVIDANYKDAKELLVEGTSVQAFQIMKDAIYNTKTIKESLADKSVHEFFAVLDLVTRYEIPKLLVSVRVYLNNFPLTENNVLEVAEDAMYYAETFEDEALGDEARTLLLTCAEFLKPKFNDAQSVFEYAAQNESRKDVVFKLQVLMKDVDKLSKFRKFGIGRMSHNTDWISRIQKCKKVDQADSDTHVPPDIAFKIEENGSTYKINAHKVVMGWASRVFNRMFFVTDTKDKNAKELLVKGTTKQAFQIMRDAIYNFKLLKDMLSGKSVHQVFAVLNLVTRYEIPELELSVKDYLTNLPLTEENVLEVAEDAMHYASTFTDAAQSLLVTCAKFLRPKFTDAQSVIEYIAAYEDHIEVLVKLLPLMKEPCANCQQDICLDGTGVQDHQWRIGLMVTNNIGNGSDGKGRVVTVDEFSDQVRVEKVECGTSGVLFGNGRCDMKLSSGMPLFLFCCK